jgi:hypothetical protein
VTVLSRQGGSRELKGSKREVAAGVWDALVAG